MTALLYVLGVVAFVVAILASIGLHELGHMIPAKAFGRKVTQHFISFGPTLLTRTKGETEFGTNATPVDGGLQVESFGVPAQGLSSYPEMQDCRDPRGT